MPAGELKLSGGANQLMEADFNYDEAEGKPETSYHVSGGTGELNVTQPGKKFHFGPAHNDWNIRLANDVPMQLKADMGAGQSDLKIGGLSLTRLDISMGAGQFTADLTGDWKKDLDAEIHGGVGHAIILLPEDVGVRVHATGGIGSISSGGLKRDGDEYVNEMYGKSPVTLRLDVSGGVGNIDLRPTPEGANNRRGRVAPASRRLSGGRPARRWRYLFFRFLFAAVRGRFLLKSTAQNLGH